MIRTWATLLLVALAAACDGEMREGSAAGVPIVRDSAGVRIVENPEPRTGAWRVEAEPVFTVGWEPDDPTFTWVQSGRILPDGGALVGDFGAAAIHRLAADGSVVATWGRKGEGPGEYGGLDAILLRGDSILVSDGRLQRLTLLSPDGEVLATRPLAGAFLHQVSAVLTDGRLLLIPGEGYSAAPEMRQEWVFETRPILAVDPETGAADTLAVLPHLRRWYGERVGSPGPIHVKGHAGGFTDGFAWTRNDEREVRWYDELGRLVQLARWEEEPVALTPDAKSRIVQSYEQAWRSSGAEESFVAARLRELNEGLDRYEGALPYWNSFYVDRLGNVWLARYTRAGEPPGSWRVLTRDGTFIGWIDLPEVLTVLDITDDRVLAVRRDEMDVPAVVMLELIKP